MATKKTTAKTTTTKAKAAPRKRATPKQAAHQANMRRGATALGIVGTLGLGLGALMHKAFSA